MQISVGLAQDRRAEWASLGAHSCMDASGSVAAVPRSSRSLQVRSFFTESQNQRMVAVGRDLCGSSSPTLLLKAGSPTVGCTGPCPGGF